MSELQALIAGFETSLSLSLEVLDVPLCVLTNDEAIATELADYYAPWTAVPVAPPVMVVRLLQGEVTPAGEFRDVERGPGRKVKEAVRDVAGGRLVLKRATGVLMGLAADHAFAVGDLRRNLNQGINLVNACYARALIRRGHLLFHAAGVSWNGRTAVLAGPPGAGKSTAALHLVDEGFRFLSNDRVLARVAAGGVEAAGYPKRPRVNPGTLLHHQRLRGLLDPDDREALLALPPAELWELERKRDVDLDALYGVGTMELSGVMHALVLLKWRRVGGTLAARRLEPAEALANLPLFHKDLGVFDVDRPAAAAARAVDLLARYADLLGRVAVVEVTGGVDHAALADVVGDLVSR